MGTARMAFASKLWGVTDMVFSSYKPNAPLVECVDMFWLYHGFQSPKLRERIFPTGTFELVFNLRNDELRIYRAGQPNQCDRRSGAVVSGAYEKFFLTNTSEEAAVLGVHFKPGGAFALLGIAAHELADTHVNLDDIWGRAAAEIRDRLCGAPSPTQQFRILEESLLSRLRRPFVHHPAVALALEDFRFGNSHTAVGDLARKAGLSERRLVDVFKSEVGLKPKVFGRIQRFQRVLAAAHRTHAPDWAQLALEQGYFDQSHLIRDFLAFSGFNPSDYVRRHRDLRKKGLEVKFNHLPLAR
jgi:AraC-like DNA-binding protein